MSNEDMISLAKTIVESSNYSFLSKEDIENNFKDFGFLVNQNKMIGYTSYMEYDVTKETGIISYSIEESPKRQQELLLMNFSHFIFNKADSFKIYYKEIPNKSTLKRFTRYLVDASVDKEFPIDNTNTLEIKEGGKSK